MAEYIKLDAIMEYCQNQKDKTINCNDLARFPTADVIELRPILEEYEKLVQTKPTSKQIDEFCVKTMRKILCDYYVKKI